MPAAFPLHRDDEFYVFLKASLPSGYRIEAEPLKGYYSEWTFRYNIYRGDALVRSVTGDYRSIETGSLVREARAILQQAETDRSP